MQGQYVEQVAVQYTESEPQYVEQYVVATNEHEAKVMFHFCTQCNMPLWGNG